MKRIIAIDGPAGAGKSTIARTLANQLGMVYFDSGAIYRFFTWVILDRDREISTEVDYTTFLAEMLFQFDIQWEGSDRLILFRQEEISSKLRQESVSAEIYKIADKSPYRNQANSYMRRLSMRYDMVIDGRDIGTVVFPETPYKFYLDASLQVRARRRYLELVAANPEQDFLLEEIEKTVAERDSKDRNRPSGALRKAEDAIVIESGELSVEAVVKLFIQEIRRIEKQCLDS